METTDTTKATTAVPGETTARRHKTSKTGRVVGNSMDKSVVVLVEDSVLHRRYHRFVKRSSKFMAHDEENVCQVGDKVVIRESRPLSRRKRWRVTQVVEKAR